MTIDIISYSDSQYARMTETQIHEVKNAQMRKDALAAKLKEDKAKEKYRLIKNGTFRSGMYGKVCEQLDAEYETKVEKIREQLLFYLRFVMKSDLADGESAPYEVDYSLEYVDRYNAVKAYYLATYSNAQKRLEAYEADNVARDYLGEYYATLYDYLAALA